MIQKKYEEYTIYLVFITITSILELLIVLYLFNMKMYKYQVLPGLIENNKIVLLINKKERKYLYQNSTLYLDDRLTKYKIISDTKTNKYREIVIKIDTSKHYKNNDFVNITIKTKKYYMTSIIKDIIGGG